MQTAHWHVDYGKRCDYDGPSWRRTFGNETAARELVSGFLGEWRASGYTIELSAHDGAMEILPRDWPGLPAYMKAYPCTREGCTHRIG